jgi:hypothetical protein
MTPVGVPKEAVDQHGLDAEDQKRWKGRSFPYPYTLSKWIDLESHIIHQQNKVQEYLQMGLIRYESYRTINWL